MGGDSRKAVGREAVEWGADIIEAEIRVRICGMIQGIVEEEFEAALGAGKPHQVGAAGSGYRHASRERQLTTSLGPTTIMMTDTNRAGSVLSLSAQSPTRSFDDTVFQSQHLSRC